MQRSYGVARDPTTVLHRHLVKALPERADRSGNPLEYVHLGHLPDGWNPNMGVAVVVGDDAGQVAETTHDRDLVRVSVHAPDFNAARKMGRRIREYLYQPFTALGLGINRRRSTKLIVGPDSLAGGWVSTASYSCGMSKFFTQI